MWHIAVVVVSAQQCLKPGPNHTVSPGLRISLEARPPAPPSPSPTCTIRVGRLNRRGSDAIGEVKPNAFDHGPASAVGCGVTGVIAFNYTVISKEDR